MNDLIKLICQLQIPSVKIPTRKLKIPLFNFFLSLQPYKWSNQGKRLYQVNLCTSMTRLPIFMVLARPEAPNSAKHRTPPPNSPKETRSSTVTSIKYLRHLLILPTKFHLSTLSVFQDFRFPPPTPPNVNRSSWDLE